MDTARLTLPGINRPWAITPQALAAIRDACRHGFNVSVPVHPWTEAMDVEASAGGSGAAGKAPYQVVGGGVAVLSLCGVLMKGDTFITRWLGGTSMERAGCNFAMAMADPDVCAILLYIDSPGGTVEGTSELAGRIAQARGQGKPILAYTDGRMGSGAYWIGSQADAVFISGDTTEVGSIRYTSHVDISGMENQTGRKTTVLAAGRYKATGHQYAPLSDADARTMQGEIDYLYSVFVRAVAAARPALNLASADESQWNMVPWGEGRVFIGRQAIDAGLVDGVASPGALVRDYRDYALKPAGRFSAGGNRPTARAAVPGNTARSPRPAHTIRAQIARDIHRVFETRRMIEAEVRLRGCNRVDS